MVSWRHELVAPYPRRNTGIEQELERGGLMDAMFRGQGGILKRPPDSWPRARARRQETASPFAARQRSLAIQRILIDIGVFAVAAGISLLSALTVNELLLHRPYELLQTPDGLAERIAELVLLGSVMLAWFGRSGHYTRRTPFWSEAHDIVVTVALMALIDCALQYMTKDPFSRLWLLQHWIFAAVLLIVGRTLLKRLILADGVWQLRTLVVGHGDDVDEVVDALESEPALGYRVVGTLDPDQGYSAMGDASEREALDRPALEWGWLAALCRRHGIENLVLACNNAELARMKVLLRELSRHEMPYAIVPPPCGIAVHGLHVQHFVSHDVVLMKPRDNLARTANRGVKRAFDLAVASAALLFLAPLMVVTAMLVRRDGGPALYAHGRIGLHGRRFRCLKFRTMVSDADQVLEAHLAASLEAAEEWARDRKLRDDPRLTPLGRFLRKSSIDELPQLINVLKGDMSLVGPRPIVESEQSFYGDDLGFYLQVRPGITGLWQVSGRNNLSYTRRVALDGWYARNWSLWHDIAILCGTVPAVLRREGAY
jgi:Undecaprenyl-phosphate galactose phosphotransferase WbaP